MDYEDEYKFTDCVNHLQLVCQSWSLFFEYLSDSWVIPYKKYFVKAWTNKILNLGNTTSNKYVYILYIDYFFHLWFMLLSVKFVKFVTRLSLLTGA